MLAAVMQDFLVIPILPYEVYYTCDYQLCLVEHFLLKLDKGQMSLLEFKGCFHFLQLMIREAELKLMQ